MTKQQRRRHRQVKTLRWIYVTRWAVLARTGSCARGLTSSVI